MTNEQLAELIAQGDNDELLPLLWEKTRKLFGLMSDKFFNSYRSRCEAAGVTAEDIKQESYFAMLEAVKYYAARSDKSESFTFTTFCKLPFKNHAMSLIGARTKRQANEPLNNCKSLDEPLSSFNGDDMGTLCDTIALSLKSAALCVL